MVNIFSAFYIKMRSDFIVEILWQCMLASDMALLFKIIEILIVAGLL